MNQGTESNLHESGKNGNERQAGSRLLLLISSAGLSATIFAADLQLPSEVASSAAYVVPVMLASWREDPRRVVVFGTLATVLTGAGFVFSQAAAAAWIALSNRALALVAIWATVAMVARVARAQDALRREKRRLSNALEAQTTRLHETGRTLRHAERLAEVGRRAGTVAHELRNPLGTIATSLKLLEAKFRGPDEQVSGAFARAKRAIGRCERIITEHLDFARATGHHPKPVVLDEWLSASLDEMKLPETVTLVRELNATSAVVHIDTDALRRAVINIVDNACEAMTGIGDNEAVPPRILSVRSATDLDGVQIAVTDNGPGIPADILARLPEPMFSTKASGTGFGLSAVQRIMQDHAGSLRIESKPGAGTTVTLRLPMGGQN